MITADNNPFRVTRIESLTFRAPDFTWTSFLENLTDHSYRGAIVGPHGSGKTTLLLETQCRLKAQGIPVYYGFLNEATSQKRHTVAGFLRELPRNAVFFLDGAEQLDPVTWHWLRWRTKGLRGFIVTTHKPGRLPTLYNTGVSEELLRELLAQLTPEDGEAQWQRACHHFREYGGNIREVFFALYDDCARGGPGTF